MPGTLPATFPVNGKFTQPQREIYDIVLESLETALKLYRRAPRSVRSTRKWCAL